MFRLGLAGPAAIPRAARDVTAQVGARLAARGVEAVVAHFGALPDAEATRVRGVLAEHGVRIVQLAGYRPNLVDPDGAARTRALDDLRPVLDTVRALGADMFLTGCGSVNPASFYGPHPDNHHPGTRARLIESLTMAARMAEQAQVVFALECHVLTTLDTPEHIAEILAGVGSPWIKANFDPVNLIGGLGAAYDTAGAMRHMVELLRPYYVPVAHLKDVAVKVDGFPLQLEEVPPGRGLVDFDVLLELAAQLGESPTLVLEHLTAQQVEPALSYVNSAIARFEAARAGVADTRSGTAVT